MAQTMIYTCDICKQSKSKCDLAKIKVSSSGIKIKQITSTINTILEIDICPDCLKKKGFVVETNSDEELVQAQEQNKVTLEDKIYDFLRDMGVVFEE